MSQHDYNIALQTLSTFVNDLNAALVAIASHNSGPSAPTRPIAFMLWADTTNDLLKIRDAANATWITIGRLSTGLSRPGEVLQIATSTYSAGVGRMGTTWGNMTQNPGVNITPKSTNSTLIVECCFEASVSAVPGVVTQAQFKLYESTGASAGYMGYGGTLNAGGNQLTAPVILRWPLANSALTPRTFWLYGAGNHADVFIGANSQVWTVTEVQA
jgi:hypothetical protein